MYAAYFLMQLQNICLYQIKPKCINGPRHNLRAHVKMLTHLAGLKVLAGSYVVLQLLQQGSGPC